MVFVTVSYTIEAINTGVQHDLICGCSLLDPNTGEELVMLPWWVIWNVPTNSGYGITITASGDLAAGTYLAIAKAWENYSEGTKVGDLDSIGEVYRGGTGSLTGELDAATQTLIISENGGVSVVINNFTMAI